jgi:hypothetical protein
MIKTIIVEPAPATTQLHTALSGKSKTFRNERSLTDDVCSMCGEHCAMKIVGDYLKK